MTLEPKLETSPPSLPAVLRSLLELAQSDVTEHALCEQALRLVCGGVSAGLSAEVCLRRGEDERLVRVAGWPENNGVGDTLALADAPLLKTALLSGQAQRSRGSVKPPESAHAQGVCETLYLPLSCGATCLGVIALRAKDDALSSIGDVASLECLALVLADAIWRRRVVSRNDSGAASQRALTQTVGQDSRRRMSMSLAGVGAWTWDLRSNRVEADHMLAQLCGLDEATLSDSENFLRRVHPDDRADLERSIQNAIESGDYFQAEFRFLRPDGREVWLAGRGGLIQDAAGTAMQLCGVNYDITEHKRVEQTLAEAKEALDAANRAKDIFIAKVSHEIRTPLTAILGYADLLLRRLKHQSERADAAEIKQNGEYLRDLIDDLLDLSRVAAGQLRLDIKAVSLPDLLRDISSTLGMRAEEKGVGFIVDMPADLPQWIATDPTRLRQILYNLIGNAIKFTDEGEVSVKLRVEGEGDDAVLVFSIEDSGPGIAESELRNIFQPFAQVADGPFNRGNGLGLGLAISERLAQLLQGVISVESRLGEGSTFSLRVPARPAAPADMSSAPAQRRLVGRVLVVDDVATIRNLICRQLQAAGAEVGGAADGLQTLAMVDAARRQDQPFDLILMDIRMPELDGYETLSRLRAAGVTTPIIALTATVMKGKRERCLAHGFVDFLAKPIETDVLLRAAAAALSNPAPSEASAVSAPRLRAMLVEDYEPVARMTARQLEGLGYEVLTMTQGRAALREALIWLPDVVVTDLSLADMDGEALCRALKREPALSATRFVAYTGRAEDGDHRAALAAGFDAVLVKPASPAQLEAAVSGYA